MIQYLNRKLNKEEETISINQTGIHETECTLSTNLTIGIIGGTEEEGSFGYTHLDGKKNEEE